MSTRDYVNLGTISRVLYVLLGVCAVGAGLWMLGAAWYDAGMDVWLERKAISTSGHVIAKSHAPSTGRGEDRESQLLEVSYAFEAHGGGMIEGKVSVAAELYEVLAPGAPVEIRHHPSDQTINWLARSNARSLSIAVLLIATLGGLLFLVLGAVMIAGSLQTSNFEMGESVDEDVRRGD